MFWSSFILAARTILATIWLVLRPVLGWLFIVVGLIGLPLPIFNGLIFLVIGIILVGPRNYVLRWSRVRIKLLLRRWAALPTPLIGPLGRLANRAARQVSRGGRRLHWWWLDRRS